MYAVSSVCELASYIQKNHHKSLIYLSLYASHFLFRSLLSKTCVCVCVCVCGVVSVCVGVVVVMGL